MYDIPRESNGKAHPIMYFGPEKVLFEAPPSPRSNPRLSTGTLKSTRSSHFHGKHQSVVPLEFWLVRKPVHHCRPAEDGPQPASGQLSSPCQMTVSSVSSLHRRWWDSTASPSLLSICHWPQWIPNFYIVRIYCSLGIFTAIFVLNFNVHVILGIWKKLYVGVLNTV